MKLCFTRINTNELHLEFGTEGDPVHKTKFRRPPAPSLLIALNKHGYNNFGVILDDRIELPRSCAHESMRRSVGIVCSAAKPGKADRNSAANCLALLPSRFRAEKERFFAAGRAPGSHVRSVHVHLAVRKR